MDDRTLCVITASLQVCLGLLHLISAANEPISGILTLLIMRVSYLHILKLHSVVQPNTTNSLVGSLQKGSVLLLERMRVDSTFEQEARHALFSMPLSCKVNTMIFNQASKITALSSYGHQCKQTINRPGHNPFREENFQLT